MNNSEITIVLPIEIKGREFDSRLLLAYHLAKEGYQIVIGDRAGVERETKHVQNCIYIAKSLAYSQKDMYENFHTNNGKVLILYEEGAYVGRLKNVASEIESAYPKGMLPHIDGILVYGDSFNKVLKDHVEELNGSNVFTIGNPRFDLHKPKYFSYFNSKTSEIKNKIGKYILFNGNFVRGNHHLGQEHLRNEIENNQELNSEAKTIFFSMMKESKKQLDSFISMISKVADEFPDISLVVRPHPGEHKKIYFENLSKFKNIHITNEGMAYPWIIGSEIIVHQDCTTAIESLFAEKPIISYYSHEDATNLFWLSRYLSDKSRDEDEMIKKIKCYLKQSYQLTSEKKEKITNEVINYSEYSHNKLISVIEGFRSKMNKGNPDETFKTKLNLYYQRFRAFLRWKKGKYYHKSAYTISYEGVKRFEVKNRIQKLHLIENNDVANLKVSKRGINVFHIELKS